MEDSEVLSYVHAAAAALRLPLTPERAAAVAQHLARSAGIARALDAAAPAPHDELAEIFRPAPFPHDEGDA
jgi:hypothetical protein